MKKKHALALGLATSLTMVTSASAATLAQWVDSSLTAGGNWDGAHSILGADVTTTTSTNVGLGMRLRDNAGGNVPSGTGTWLLAVGGDTGSSATSTDDYWQFSAAAVSGKMLDLTSFSFNYAAGNSGTSSFTAYVSTDSGSSFTQLDDASLSPSGSALSSTINIDLTSIADTEAAIFRINISDGSGWAGYHNSVQNVQLFGDVTSAVPEPSTTALLGLGGIALILRRRK